MSDAESQALYPIVTERAHWMVHVPENERKGRYIRSVDSLPIEELDGMRTDELTIRLLQQVEEVETGVEVITVPVAKRDLTCSYLRTMHREQFAMCFGLQVTAETLAAEDMEADQKKTVNVVEQLKRTLRRAWRRNNSER